MAESEEAGTSSRVRGVKRRLSVRDGLEDTTTNVNSDYMCPVCLDLLDEPHITKCGHTFCRVCILDSMELTPKRCPKCTHAISDSEIFVPNHIVNSQVRKIKSKQSANKASGLSNLAELQLKHLLSNELTNLESSQLTEMIELLESRRLQMEHKSEHTKATLMKEFLKEFDQQTEQQLETLKKQKTYINNDLEKVVNSLKNMSTDNVKAMITDEDNTVVSDTNGKGFNIFSNPPKPSLTNRIKKIRTHFKDISDYYVNHNLKSGFIGQNTDDSYKDFGECIQKFTQYTTLRHLQTIDAGDRNLTSSNIASSIEFDKDNEYIAVAGLTRKIKLFDYNNLISSDTNIHYPFGEMVCDSKISCVTWNPYQKTLLACSDYDGKVTVWDAFGSKIVGIYNEHQKRCWSVDFNKVENKLIASGGDDAKVKIWHLDKPRSVFSLDAPANVCCVQFNPSSRFHLAFGCADHCLHYYDLRTTKEPLKVFRGHSKAVSYVKFVSEEEIVSASTDNQLKIWNVNEPPSCVQTLHGHTNEKNFVGLATNGDFVACGSENNSIYVYYKKIPSYVLKYKFEQRKILLEPEVREEDSTDFVSAICWRKDSDIIAAGNSQGLIKIFQLT